MGSQLLPNAELAPQHPLPPPVATRRAASPYFSLTTSFSSICLFLSMFPCSLSTNGTNAQLPAVLLLYCVCSTRHKENQAIPGGLRHSRSTKGTCLHGAPSPDPHS